MTDLCDYVDLIDEIVEDNIILCRMPHNSSFIPYDKYIFSCVDILKFFKWLEIHINENHSNENNLIKIIMNLTCTLEVYTKDMSQHLFFLIIQNISSFFKNSIINQLMVFNMLSNKIQKKDLNFERYIKNYRYQCIELFKNANNCLLKSVQKALDFGESFITFPIDNKLLIGLSSNAKHRINLAGTVLVESATEVDKIKIPVLPFIDTPISDFSEQCLRQYIRIIINAQYGVDKFKDSVMYVVIGLTMLVVNSLVSQEIKNVYIYLSTVMLKKKRFNVNITELDRIKMGEFPTPNNGNIEDFYEFMNTVIRILGIDSSTNPLVLWYAMCQSLKIDELIENQLVHCQNAIFVAYNNEIPTNIGELLLSNITKLEEVQIVRHKELDFTCLFTLNDCSEEGGFILKPHETSSCQICEPRTVFSNKGLEEAMNSSYGINPYCLVCRTAITEDSFELVVAKNESFATTNLTDIKIFSQDFRSPYS